MSTTYTYSYSNDFGSNLKLDQLHDEIENNITITKTLSSINKSGDNINIIFNEILSTNEQTNLNTIISNYTTNNTYHDWRVFSVNRKSNSNYYKTILSFRYDGLNQSESIDAIGHISYMDSSATSFDIRIVDRTNSNIIATHLNLNNTNRYTIHRITLISNLPVGEAIFDVDVKLVSDDENSYVHIEEFILEEFA